MPLVTLVTADLLVISACTMVAVTFRQLLMVGGNSGADVEALVRPLAASIVAVWVAAIAVSRGYSSHGSGVGTLEYRRVLTASFATMGGLGIGAYLLDYPLSRGFYFLLFVIGIPLLLIERMVLRRIIHRLHERGRLVSSVLIAGDTEHIDDVAAVLNRERWLGFQVVGALASGTDSAETGTGIPIIGSPDDVADALAVSGADIVVFAEGSFRRGRDFNAMARTLEDSHAQMIVVPSLTDVSHERMIIRPVAGIPLVHIEPPRARHALRLSKRLFDILISSGLIVLGSPIMLVVALAIRLGSSGPVLFRQVRVGLGGRQFRCLKFRSMVADAEARLAELQQHAGDSVLFKMADDPRITKVGRFIRRYSLDELPQLFNVWRGDMSLVGPRPALASEVERYQDHVMRRLDVRPGMTGLWQVSGRSDLSWDDTVRLDLYYVDNWSMLQDLAILTRTLGAVLRPLGAY